MNRKTTFIAAMILLLVSANCNASKKVIKSYSFSFADDNDEVVLEIEVSEGQPRTDINIGTKIIEVKKDSVLIARMESIRLPDFNIGESLQIIEQENNLLCIRQSFADSRYIVVSILRFEYSAGKLLLDNYEESRVDRFDEVHEDETKMISMNGLIGMKIDMNEIDDELIYTLHSVLFSYDGYDFFLDTYKVSHTYVEKDERSNETSERTYYFVKDGNLLKKYRDENVRIPKENEMRIILHKNNSVLFMITNHTEICSLYKIKFMKGNTIAINDDVYVLEKESYDRLCSNTIKKSDSFKLDIDTIFSLFSMTPYFLIDGTLSMMPYLFCNIERYKILKGSFSVENPHSYRRIVKHACTYEYDEKGNLASMTFRCENPNSAGVDYHLEVVRRTGKEILMKESYSMFERMHQTQVLHFDFGKQECDMAGDYFHCPTSREFFFSEIIRCEKMPKRE